jgi:hypothetical protein
VNGDHCRWDLPKNDSATEELCESPVNLEKREVGVIGCVRPYSVTKIVSVSPGTLAVLFETTEKSSPVPANESTPVAWTKKLLKPTLEPLENVDVLPAEKQPNPAAGSDQGCANVGCF